MTKNILLTGVGGQGTILASRLLTLGLQDNGYDVKMSEVHGMSQREGPVLTHVRYGKKSGHRLYPRKKVISSSALRNLKFCAIWNILRDDGEGVVILNRARVNPIGVLSGKDVYPPNIQELIEARAGRVIALDATEEAEKLGNPRTMNIILLGVALKALGLHDEIDWNKIIAENVREQFVEVNQKALKLGMSLV